MESTRNLSEIIFDKKEQIINETAEFLKEYADHAGYQVDLYMYVGEDEELTFKTFDNVGGRSWIDDDHITICSHSDADEWDREGFFYGADLKEDYPDFYANAKEEIEKAVAAMNKDDYIYNGEFDEEDYNKDVEAATLRIFIDKNLADIDEMMKEEYEGDFEETAEGCYKRLYEEIVYSEREAERERKENEYWAKLSKEYYDTDGFSQ